MTPFICRQHVGILFGMGLSFKIKRPLITLKDVFFTHKDQELD